MNEQNVCIGFIHLFNTESSVAPHRYMLSVWQRIELTSSKNMEQEIGKL
jgi:hypothetical protein